MEFRRTWPAAPSYRLLLFSFLDVDVFEFGQFLSQQHMGKSLIYDIRRKEKVVSSNLLPLGGEKNVLKERGILGERGGEKKKQIHFTVVVRVFNAAANTS